MKKSAVTLHFCELLLVLLKGKTSLMDALYILSKEGVEKQVRKSALSLLVTMKKGKGFSESLRIINEGKVFFEPVYLSLIAASELTGNIEAVLERIVVDMQRKKRTKENAINILIYPSIVVFLALAGTIALIVKGMPFLISGGLLSASVVTDAKIGIGIAGTVLLAGGAALFITYFKIFNYDLPEFRIFYLLDFLLKSNITLIEALSHCIVNMAKSKYGAALLNIKKDIVAGINFSAAFARTAYFPAYVLGWLSVADKHGNLDEICGNIKNYYERKDEKRRDAAAKLLEPAIIVLIGLYVLIIMLNVVLPILSYAGGIL